MAAAADPEEEVERSESIRRITCAFGICLQALDDLTKKERIALLSTLAAQNQCVIQRMPFLVPASAVPLAPPPRKGPDRGNAKRAAVAPKADPETKGLRDKIKDLNRRISERSATFGGRPLSAFDSLIVERDELFRQLQGTRDRRERSKSVQDKEVPSGPQDEGQASIAHPPSASPPQ